jgi:hypothetical protein
LESTAVIAAKRKKNSAGVVPVDFKSAKNALKRTNGGSVMVLPGFAQIVNVLA